MVLKKIIEGKNKKSKMVAMLIDPDKLDQDELFDLCQILKNSKLHFLMVGGSLITSDRLEDTVKTLKTHTHLPVILFPGNSQHISNDADAILFLSLISGRNPEFLIGQHVVSAPLLKRSQLEVISTAYMLVDGGKPTTVSYISNTTPLPADKPDIAAATAIAGEFIGMKINYLDAGSGALKPVSKRLISKVKDVTQNPLIVGGGINSIEKLENAFDSGADLVVIGNAFESNPEFFYDVNQWIAEQSHSHVG